MNRVERIYKIHELLRSARLPVPMSRFIEVLESSRNSITRDFEYLRNILGAPIQYCRDHNGHQYDPQAPVFELPGFWMNQSELYALLACEQLLEQVQSGLMSERLQPLKERIRKLLGESGHSASRINETIRISPVQVRTTPAAVFDVVAEAVLSGRQLIFDYTPRSHTVPGLRTTHPQRLIHYRSNWYLIAICERAGEARIFSIDRIRSPEILNSKSKESDINELDQILLSGFGIFSGKAEHIAHLKFSHHAARWVAEESWHPDQRGEWYQDGYCLMLPYSNSSELVMDILRHGAEVEVLAPDSLRAEVAQKIKKACDIYW